MGQSQSRSQTQSHPQLQTQPQPNILGEPVMFNYRTAFSRNRGWLTEDEQIKLQQATVAIAGLGGVGGSHLVKLVRLGIQNFHIADFDVFELQNFNRQYGADMQTIGKSKAHIMAERARAINPEVQIRVFERGIQADNISEFLNGVSIYVDGLDFFELDIRKYIFRACWERKISAITAAPVGMGTSLLHFVPGKMSFDQYFGFQDGEYFNNVIRFMVGLTPTMQQRSYLIDDRFFNIREKRAPSTGMACELAAGVVGVEVLKTILKRGSVYPAPWNLHFDAYNWQLKKRYSILGAKSPYFRLKCFLLKRIYNLMKKEQN